MREFCTLTIGRETYGVELSALREVIEPLTATRVPLAPAEVRGVMNLRGELTPVLAIDRWLDLPAQESQIARRPWLALLSHGAHRFGVLVDKVGTARTEDDTLQPPPDGEGLQFEGLAASFDPPLRVLRLPALIGRLDAALSLENFTTVSHSN